MPSYLINEGGERTHAVIPVEEHERLRKAAEKAESIRSYAEQIMAAMGQDEETPEENERAANGHLEESGQDRNWHT